ncbi:MAG: hypothetical protein K8T90_10885 [Planctomycetes bacterium]|nr:hypothetical protein [Planctomycetota bacterium]
MTTMIRRALGIAILVAVPSSGCGERASDAPVSAAGASASPADVPASPVPSAISGPSREGPDGSPSARTTPGGPWIDTRGTSIVGFGLLRLVPGAAGASTFRLRYREVPDGYATAATGTANLQLFVLPADAFAAADRAYADAFLAFVRTEDDATTADDGSLRLETTVTSASERTVIVAYGPWTAPDAGRPAGDEPTFRIDVTSADGAFEWIESEAGELITTNWTNRPGVARGGPVHDPVTAADAWIEVRPMILYDGRMVRGADEPPAVASLLAPGTPTPAALRDEAERLAAAGDTALAADRRERAADLDAHLARADGRLVVTPALAEKFRRVPIRWR